MAYRARPGEGIVWITGASSGIGRAVALEMARRGFSVVASARREEELTALAGEAAATAGRIAAFPLDVSDRDAMRSAAATIEAAHGEIAVAFFNAGVAPYTRAGEFDAAAFDKAFAVNVMATVDGLSTVMPLMIARRRGQIAITASLAGYGGLPRASAYGGSKAALINIAESLKFDCDQAGVTLQVVNPGFVDTPLTRKNNFPMPFLVTEADAAKSIADGFAKGGFEIVFPWLFARLMKLINILPYGLYFPLVARATGWSREKK